ncbi:hypothetical protein GCM10022232_27760 [Streptomyces plumbiresistens]|uniref:Uncharacterized protein n=1 Tax=Streptomyces plumbiresistens TaxID=511811 RepID=A0ABP7R2A1_9ACTN
MASGHEHRRTRALCVTSKTLFACGAAWMVSAAGLRSFAGVGDRHLGGFGLADPFRGPVLDPDCW